MKIIRCDFENHGQDILDIFNEAILNSTALYEYKPRTMQTMQAWFAGKAVGGFPVIAAIDDDETFLGFASYGTFRAFPAFKYSMEHSVYVDSNHRSRGVGKVLLQEIIRLAQQNQLHVLVGGIDAANEGSIALHTQLGFVPCGTIKQAGFKFGRWLDLAFYQLVLPTPLEPIDG
jgi:L-amino acid N-acyltransferase